MKTFFALAILSVIFSSSAQLNPLTVPLTDPTTGLPIEDPSKVSFEEEVQTNLDYVADHEKSVKDWAALVKKENARLDTNNFGPLILRTASGRSVSNAYIYKLETTRAFWKTESGEIGSIYPSNMPPKMLARFPYDDEIIHAIELSALVRKQTNDLAVIKAREKIASLDADLAKYTPYIQGDPCEVGNAAAKVTEDNDTWQRWSYRIPVRNLTSTTSKTHLEIQFMDAGGYVLHEKSEYGVEIGPWQDKVITGSTLIEHPQADRVKSLKILKK